PASPWRTLGGCPSNRVGCGARSGGCERGARSFLLRRAFRHASSVVAALPALAPRLVRLARHDYEDRLLAIEEIERQREDIGHGHRRAREAGLRADRHRAFLRALREPPVCSLD